MITLTETAAQKISKQIQHQQGVGIHFGVKRSGCSGYAYTVDVIESPPVTQDWMSYESYGVKIWVRSDALPIVDGTTIDWQRQGLNERVVFINNRETSRCGCQESFAI